MLTLPHQLRAYLGQNGAPISLIDPQEEGGYLLMPVRFTYTDDGRVMARVPGLLGTGIGDDSGEALARLGIRLQETQDLLIALENWR